MSYARTRTRSSGSSSPVLLGTSSTMLYPYCDFVNPVSMMSCVRGLVSDEVCNDFVNPGPPYKEGHEFFLKRKTAEYIDSDAVSINASYYKYSGRFSINRTSDDTISSAYENYSPTAQTYGAQAINRMRPVQPRMGLGQALGEIRDFPSLFKVSLRRFKDLGNLYLNYEFGWRPFIKDLLDFINMQKNLGKHIRFVRKNNNKWLRRRTTIRDTVDITTASVGTAIMPSLASQLYWPTGSVPRVTRTLIIKDKIWAEGVMKYYIPELHLDGAENIWTSPLIRKLTGFEITPSLLWELTPWTWLTDWMVNVGTLYDNFTNQMYDNLVTKYAYVMRHRQTSAVYVGSVATQMKPPNCSEGRLISWLTAYPGPVPIARAVFTAECKERAQAAWWGIGNSDGSSYTDRQLAILLALGLQRLV